jgi:ClpP class serine protease
MKQRSHHDEHSTERTMDTAEMRERILQKRRKIIATLGKKRGSRVITLVHRREPWLEGEQSITIEDTEHVLMEIHRTPRQQPIDIIIHTPGGLVLATAMIATALYQHLGKVTAIVPFYAMSGGTMIALAADEVLMEEFSVLGPLDPQINGMAAGALIQLAKAKPIEALADETLLLADLADKALKEVRGYIDWFLEEKEMSAKQKELVAEFLVGGYIAHDRPLSFATVQGLQLPVKKDVPEEVFDLFSTCVFGQCDRPGLACHQGCHY